ncbi:hypothetical protein HDV04_000114 [Boothiomyces sp. JEL0838]|nr:hypothetical protein HDV04_000114 [Boothiomyces sp. JEL0838]
MPQLKSLKLEYCNITNSQLDVIVSNLDSLEYLSVRGCPISRITYENLYHVNVLDISATKFKAQDLALLAGLPSLKSLSASNLPYTQSQSEYLSDAISLLNLNALNLSNTPCGVTALLQCNETVLSSLESLTFGSRTFIQDLTCRNLFQYLQNLVYLEFSDEVSLSEVGLVHILSRTKMLKELLLPTQAVTAQLQMISSSTLFKIPILLKYLETFRAIGYPFNSDILMEFSQRAKNLHVLNIRNPINHSPEITIDCVKTLIEQCPYLIELQLKGSRIPVKKLSWLRKIYWRVLII